MTQAWRPDFSQPDDPNWNATPAPRSTFDYSRCASVYGRARCTEAANHTSDHVNATTVWPNPFAATDVANHHVLRLDNGDAERFPRLAALVALYDAAKSAADAAAAALKTITDGIKAETSAAIPGGTDFTIISGSLAHPLTLQYVVSNRVDTKALRAMLTAEQYASLTKPSGSWTLKPKRG